MVRRLFGRDRPATLRHTSPLLSFIGAVTFFHAVPAVLSSGFLPPAAVADLARSHGAIRALVLASARTRSVDPDVVRQPRLDRTTGPAPRHDRALSEAMLAAAISFNCAPARLLRWLGGEFYAAHRPTSHLRVLLAPSCTPDHINEVIRVLSGHSPRRLFGEGTDANLREYLEYGNHASVDGEDAAFAVNKVVDKDDRAQFVVTLPRWMWRFIPHLHLTPLGLLLKGGKARLLFDARFRPSPESFSLNDVTRASDELPVAYGTAFVRHLRQIFNLRISFPAEDILLWDDDVKGAFRLAKYHPDVAAAFSFAFGEHLFVPVGNTFGSNTSPQTFDVVAAARSRLAHFLAGASRRGIHPSTSFSIEDRIVFPAPPPAVSGLFTPAVADDRNPGVPVFMGTAPPAPHNMFVDDNLVANIRGCILADINASIESLFLLLGFPEEALRPMAIAMDKFVDRPLSHLRLQLGFMIDTRSMRVFLPLSKVEALLQQLDLFCVRRMTFLPLEAAALLGVLVHASTVCPWARHVTIALRRDLCAALRASKAALESARGAAPPLPAALPRREKYWHAGVFARRMWRPRKGAFLSSESATDVRWLRQCFRSCAPSELGAFIHALVPRAPEFAATAGSSVTASGASLWGSSVSLDAHWSVGIPADIAARVVVRRLPSSPSASISLQELDFASILLAVAAVMSVTASSPREVPCKFAVDTPRTSAMDWVLRPPSGEHHVRCLLRLFGGLLFASGLNVDRALRSSDSSAAAAHPASPPPPQAFSPAGSRLFRPTPGMLSLVFSALRGERHFMPQIPLRIGQLVPVATSGGGSAVSTS